MRRNGPHYVLGELEGTARIIALGGEITEAARAHLVAVLLAGAAELRQATGTDPERVG